MKRIALAVFTALLATLGLAGAASAHHPTGITIDPSCPGKLVAVDVGFGSFGDGHYMTTTIDVNGTVTTIDSAGLSGDGTLSYQVALQGYSGTITVSAQARYPGGEPEGQPVTSTKPYDCPKPPPPPRYRPKAWLNGPCGDPMYRAVLDNRRSDRAVTFAWVRRSHGVWRVTRRTVQAGKLVRTKYRHVDGLTTTRVRARGKVLVSLVSAPGGTYRACR